MEQGILQVREKEGTEVENTLFFKYHGINWIQTP
jgi:hypothetical protein